MKKIVGYALMAFSLPFFALAILTWISSGYPDIEPFQFLGIWESGIGGALQTAGNWLRVVLMAVPGVILWTIGLKMKGSSQGNIS